MMKLSLKDDDDVVDDDDDDDGDDDGDDDDDVVDDNDGEDHYREFHSYIIFCVVVNVEPKNSRILRLLTYESLAEVWLLT